MRTRAGRAAKVLRALPLCGCLAVVACSGSGSGGAGTTASPVGGGGTGLGTRAASTATTTSTIPGASAEQNEYLACVRQEESGDDYAAVSEDGAFFGAYQIDQETWNNTALHANVPDAYEVQPNEAAPATQDAVALALLEWQGTSPWEGDC